MFYFRYVDLCNKINKSPSAVAEELGFKRSSVTRWANNSAPRQATLQKIADYFGVTVEYLKGDETKNAPAPNKGTEVFMKMYDMLTPERQARLYETLSDLVKEQMQER